MVVVILRNISILMHLKELISFKKTWKDLGYKVKILGIDFKGELIPIGNVARMVSKQQQFHRL